MHRLRRLRGRVPDAHDRLPPDPVDDETVAKTDAILDRYRGGRDSLIMMLQDVQTAFN